MEAPPKRRVFAVLVALFLPVCGGSSTLQQTPSAGHTREHASPQGRHAHPGHIRQERRFISSSASPAGGAVPVKDASSDLFISDQTQADNHPNISIITASWPSEDVVSQISDHVTAGNVENLDLFPDNVFTTKISARPFLKIKDLSIAAKKFSHPKHKDNSQLIKTKLITTKTDSIFCNTPEKQLRFKPHQRYRSAASPLSLTLHRKIRNFNQPVSVANKNISPINLHPSPESTKFDLISTKEVYHRSNDARKFEAEANLNSRHRNQKTTSDHPRMTESGTEYQHVRVPSILLNRARRDLCPKCDLLPSYFSHASEEIQQNEITAPAVENRDWNSDDSSSTSANSEEKLKEVLTSEDSIWPVRFSPEREEFSLPKKIKSFPLDKNIGINDDYRVNHNFQFSLPRADSADFIQMDNSDLLDQVRGNIPSHFNRRFGNTRFKIVSIKPYLSGRLTNLPDYIMSVQRSIDHKRTPNRHLGHQVSDLYPPHRKRYFDMIGNGVMTGMRQNHIGKRYPAMEGDTDGIVLNLHQESAARDDPMSRRASNSVSSESRSFLTGPLYLKSLSSQHEVLKNQASKDHFYNGFKNGERKRQPTPPVENKDSWWFDQSVQNDAKENEWKSNKWYLTKPLNEDSVVLEKKLDAISGSSLGGFRQNFIDKQKHRYSSNDINTFWKTALQLLNLHIGPRNRYKNKNEKNELLTANSSGNNNQRSSSKRNVNPSSSSAYNIYEPRFSSPNNILNENFNKAENREVALNLNGASDSDGLTLEGETSARSLFRNNIPLLNYLLNAREIFSSKQPSWPTSESSALSTLSNNLLQDNALLHPEIETINEDRDDISLPERPGAGHSASNSPSVFGLENGRVESIKYLWPHLNRIGSQFSTSPSERSYQHVGFPAVCPHRLLCGEPRAERPSANQIPNSHLGKRSFDQISSYGSLSGMNQNFIESPSSKTRRLGSSPWRLIGDMPHQSFRD